MNRGLTIALVASLAFNGLLVGFVAGRLWDAPHGVAGRAAHHEGPLGLDVAALDPAERRAFHEIFHASRDALKARHREVLRLRREFGAALAAEAFDRNSAEAALAKLQAAEGVQHAALGALLIDAFENLSHEDRKALVSALEKRHRMMRGRFGRLRGEGGPPRFGVTPPPSEQPDRRPDAVAPSDEPTP
jgi:uncharacterized membrane protein